MRLSDIATFFPSAQKEPPYPKRVLIEATNVCNLHCKSCHIWGEGVSSRREVGFIPESIFRKAVDEISGWQTKVDLIMHGAGEPLMHKDFINMLAYAASKENISAGFLSNGSLLTEDVSRAVLETDIGWIGFSIDGAQEEQFKENRGIELEKVESAVSAFLALKRGDKPFTFVNMVALPGTDSEKFVERWIDRVDEVRVSAYRPVGRRDFLKDAIKRDPCYLLNEMLVVTWNGKAVLCCEDIWAENIMGVFPGNSLFDIWHSPAFDKMRRLHTKGRHDNIKICSDCDVWSTASTTVEIDEERNLRIARTTSQKTYSRISKLSRR